MAIYITKPWYKKGYSEPDTWEPIDWGTYKPSSGEDVWSDGDNIYYSKSNKSSENFIFDSANESWSLKTWSFLMSSFHGTYVWTDLDGDVYVSVNRSIMHLNKSTGNWENISCTFPDSSYTLYGTSVFTDGYDVYSSSKGGYPTRLIKTSPTVIEWRSASWSGRSSFNGVDTWTDGKKLYMTDNNINTPGSFEQASRGTRTWNTKTWNISTGASFIWTDGVKTYLSWDSNHYVLNTTTGEWERKTWNGLTNFRGQYVWTDGNNIYYSKDDDQYKLVKR